MGVGVGVGVDVEGSEVGGSIPAEYDTVTHMHELRDTHEQRLGRLATSATSMDGVYLS